ncbi:MAG: Dabb family protein [Phycisphaera sp.]|nr:MAG: Dabb family protein [Phycisphaera sp.]
MYRVLTVVVLAFAAIGCHPGMIGPHDFTAPAPGKINHVVFFDLTDPGESDELIDDCYELLEIPGAVSGYAGKHYDIGRDSILSDYDVGFFVAFDSEEDYRAYVGHTAHIALVEKWKPRWDSIRVYDVGDHWRVMRDQ